MQTNKTWHAKWWTEDKHGGAWERVKDAFKRDWEQTKADVSSKGQELNQDVGDTVKQAAGKQAIPPPNVPNPTDTATTNTWEAAEPAYSYGYGAKQEYGTKYPKWNDDLDRELSTEWKTQDKARNWEEVRPFVRRGFEQIN